MHNPDKGRISDAALAGILASLPRWLLSVTGHPVEVSADGSRLRAFCPICGHHKPKLEGVFRGDRWVATCRVCGAGGDLVKLAQSVYGCGFREAVERAGDALGTIPALPAKPPERLRGKESGSDPRATWPDLEPDAESGVPALAALRGIPWYGIRLVHDLGLLRFATYRNHRCWVLRDHAGRCAEARRMDGLPWFDEVKALAFPGSIKTGTLIGENLLGPRPDPVFLVEGGADFLCAATLAYESAGIPGAPYWTPLGFLGAAFNFTEGHLERLRGRLVRIFVHDDDRGRDAAERWHHDLQGVGCTVELVHVGNLAITQPDGKPVTDLNDAIRAQPDFHEFAQEATAP